MFWLRLYTVVLHLASWMAFFLLVVILAPRPHLDFHSPDPPFPPFLVLVFPPLAAFYYLNSKVLIPKLLAFQKTSLYLVALGISGLALMGIPRLETFVFSPPPGGHHPPEIQSLHTLIAFSLFLVVLIASSGKDLVLNWYSAEGRKREMELEKTRTELSFLKSQINPHFLFNTLNSIYTLALLKPEIASSSILKLADMMRYVLTGAGDKPVPLEEEIHYLEQFIELQKIRLTDRVKVEFRVYGDTTPHVIAPLLLLPFVENAFKYGISTRQPSQILISLTLKPDTLVFQTENTVSEDKIAKELSTGTGLKNTRRRLEILYPEKHWIRLESIGSTFFADLTLHS